NSPPRFGQDFGCARAEYVAGEGTSGAGREECCGRVSAALFDVLADGRPQGGPVDLRHRAWNCTRLRGQSRVLARSRLDPKGENTSGDQRSMVSKESRQCSLSLLNEPVRPADGARPLDELTGEWSDTRVANVAALATRRRMSCHTTDVSFCP